MQIDVITELDSLREYGPAWNGLLTAGATNTVFQTFEWHISWWEAHGADHDMLVLLARDNRKIVGIAPLMIARRKGMRTERVLGFIAAEDASSDYCDFIVPGAGTEIVRAMLGYLCGIRNWTIFELKNIPEQSPHRETVAAFFRSARIPLLQSMTAECPTLLLNDSRHTSTVLNKKSLKRHERWFQQNGKLEIKHLKDPAQILSLIDQFFDQHVSRRASTETPSLFLLESQREFYRLLVKNMAAGSLIFTVVAFNDEYVAFHLGFACNGRFIWYKPSFAPAWARRSPGEVLLQSLLKLAIELELDEFDFTVGNEAFKLRFANHVRKNYRLRIYRSRLSFYLDRLRATLGRVGRMCKHYAAKKPLES